MENPRPTEDDIIRELCPHEWQPVPEGQWFAGRYEEALYECNLCDSIRMQMK